MKIKKSLLLVYLVSLALFSASTSKAEVQGLPFEVVQEQNYWCWAALTQAFSAIKGIHKTQCEIVNDELGKQGNQSCCNPGLASKVGAGTCNPIFMANNNRRNQVLGFSALEKNGVLFLNKKPKGGTISNCSAREKAASFGLLAFLIT